MILLNNLIKHSKCIINYNNIQINLVQIFSHIVDTIFLAKNILFYVTASGGLYSSIYITVDSPNLIIFAYWTQLLEYRTHGTINFKASMFRWFLSEMWAVNICEGYSSLSTYTHIAGPLVPYNHACPNEDWSTERKKEFCYQTTTLPSSHHGWIEKYNLILLETLNRYHVRHFIKRVLHAHNISLRLIHLKTGDQHLKPADPTI